MEISLTTISEAFHTIAHEYKKLKATVPHTARVQAAQVVARLPVMPVLKQEVKIEKRERGNATEKDTTSNLIQDPPTVAVREQAEPSTSQETSAVSVDRQPIPSTSHAPSTSSAEIQPEENPNVMEELTGRREDEPNEGERSETFNRYALTSRG